MNNTLNSFSQKKAGTDLVTCSMAVGIFKPHLSQEERQRFLSAVRSVHQNFIGGRCPIFEGVNSMVFCYPFVQGIQRTDPRKNGDSCVISYISNGFTKHFFQNSSCEHEKKIDPLSLIKRLNSSWSIAIIDDSMEEVHLSRDTAGAHSMYYAIHNGIFYFTSSLTCFRKFPFTINSDAVSDFLHFLYIPAPSTIYQEVQSVLPGQIVSFSGNGIKKQLLSSTNHLTNQQKHLDLDEEEYLSGYEKKLKQSIQHSCSNDEKTALFLSGGKDSSTLAIAIKECGLKNVEAVTLSFDEPNIDESEDARTVAYHLGIPFLPLNFSPSTYSGHWIGFVKSLGQPLGDPAALPVYVAMKELQDRYDTYIDGTGNDRYLGITTTWQEDAAWHIYRLIPWLHHLPWKYLRGGFSYTVDVLKHTFSKPREEQFVSWRGWTPDEINALTGRRPNWTDISLYSIYHSVLSPMDFKTRTLCEIWEPEAAYRKTVQIASTMGRVVHFPFLDRSLIHYCEALPYSLKYRGRINKVILRKLLRKYLPPEILNKRKGVFNFPKEYILRANNYAYIHQLLSRKNMMRHNLVKPSVASIFIERYIKGDKRLEDRIWSLLLLHSWLEFNQI